MPEAHRILPLPSIALASVVAKDGKAVYASSDTLFKGAVFGRDSLEVADDLMFIKPALVRNILLNIASLQGMVFNSSNEEEPGKIIHEFRTTTLAGKPIDAPSLKIFNELSHKWGGNDHEMAYYGSVDATPQFLQVLYRHCVAQGRDILNEQVTRRDGSSVTMYQVASEAAEWTIKQITSTGSGLLEFRKQNPHGISNQVWKDSEEFYVHETAELANHNAGIASIEVQGLAYDALVGVAMLMPEQADKYVGTANTLRDRCIDLLWQPKRHYFALGTDYDSDGSLRIIATSTANPAALLDTGFFDELAPDVKQKYVAAIVKRITSRDFLTNAGIRSRSLSDAHLVGFWDYHGSYVTWPKETYDIAKGLVRQGFPKLAKQLQNRLLNLVLKTRDYPEFVYADGWGRILTGAPSKHTHGELVLVAGRDTPERLQAWTASALMAIISERGIARRPKVKPTTSTAWQSQLEAQLLGHIPQVNAYINPLKLWLQYPTYKYKLLKE